MIKKGDRIKGFQFDKDNSARVGWEEKMSKYIGVEGTVHKIAEGPHGVGSRIEIRFARHWSGDYSNESWSNNVIAMYPLAECLQLIREEKLKEIGV
jgi:hypothetical protein